MQVSTASSAEYCGQMNKAIEYLRESELNESTVMSHYAPKARLNRTSTTSSTSWSVT